MDELKAEEREGRQEEMAWLPALMEKDRLSHTSRLIRGLIHNINGPLHNLSMLGEMLMHGQEQLEKLLDEQGVRLAQDCATLCDKQRDRLQRLMHQIASLSEMLQDFSIVQETMAGKEDVDITFVLNKVVKALRADLFFKHRVDVRLHLVENLPPVHIPGRVIVPSLMHLFRNALLALTVAPEKRLFVDCSREGNLVRVAIRDTGIGFDPAKVERLFGLFHSQWPMEIREKDDLESHFGLGLFAVRSLLQPYGARVTLAREGSETVALLEIPLPE